MPILEDASAESLGAFATATRQLTEERLAVAVIIARALEISGAGGRGHG